MGTIVPVPDSYTRTALACVQGRCVCERGRGGRDLRAACPRRGGGGAGRLVVQREGRGPDGRDAGVRLCGLAAARPGLLICVDLHVDVLRS